MKKAHYIALGKLYADEIEQAMDKARIRFPYPSRAKVFRDLADLGMVREASARAGQGWSTVTVKGWELTDAGRFAYCSECVGESLKDAA